MLQALGKGDQEGEGRKTGGNPAPVLQRPKRMVGLGSKTFQLRALGSREGSLDEAIR